MEQYPDIDNPDFQRLIAQRLEFRNLHNNDGLYPHQEFVRRFMSPYTPYTSLILYHSLGSGKSLACVSVAVDHYLHDRKRSIIVTKGNSGTDNFEQQISMYHKMSKSGQMGKWKTSMFTMMHYISMSNQITKMSDEDIAKEFSNSIIVLDEVHNVRYYKRVTEDSVYGSIIRILKICANTKVIIATATPMTDNGEQIKSLLGICNHSRSDTYSMNGIISYNCAIQDKPSSKTKGVDDYVPSVRVWASNMIGHQKQAYLEEYTDKSPNDIYRKLTHISLFCFEDGTYGRNVTKSKMIQTLEVKTIVSMSTKQTKDINYTRYSIDPEFADQLEGDALRRSSAKYSATIDLLESSTGNVFIFIEEVKGSGLLLLASILEQHGYEPYMGNRLDNMYPGKRYTICVGCHKISPNNSDKLEGFNDDLNKHGDYVRVLLGSRVIGESVTMKNVRHFYCLTPHWNDSTIDQATGRVIRSRSHEALENDERNVDIYIHVAVLEDNPNNSVDIKKIMRCKDKEVDIRRVSVRMINKAVDRYCLNTTIDVPIEHVDLFAAAYVHHHYDAIIYAISFVVTGPINIYKLSEKINVHPTVCKEVLCRTIFSNVCINGKFLRAYGDIVFLVDDPSLPYVIVPRVAVESAVEVAVEVAAERIQENRLLPYGRVLAERISTTFPHAIMAFRRLNAIDKAAFLEYCIQNDIRDVLEQIDNTYADVDGTVYHLLLYRNIESSYTSSNPVPKKPLGKTRAFDTISREWTTIESKNHEMNIFSRYRQIVDGILKTKDIQNTVYGVISTIDGDMRLRLKCSDTQNDRRYVKRGKNIKSFSKGQLTKVLTMLGMDGYNMSINEIVQLIDSAIVDSRRYIVL